ncbi:hypothetical protein [Rhizobium sp.]
MMDSLISGIVKSAMTEILNKTGLKPKSTTKRTKRKTKSTSPASTSATRKRKAVSGGSSGGSYATGSGPAKKQVSKRRTSTARSKAKRRA